MKLLKAKGTNLWLASDGVSMVGPCSKEKAEQALKQIQKKRGANNA